MKGCDQMTIIKIYLLIGCIIFVLDNFGLIKIVLDDLNYGEPIFDDTREFYITLSDCIKNGSEEEKKGSITILVILLISKLLIQVFIWPLVLINTIKLFNED